MEQFYNLTLPAEILRDMAQALKEGLKMVIGDSVNNAPGFFLGPEPVVRLTGIHKEVSLELCPDERDTLWQGILLDDEGELDSLPYEYVTVLIRNLQKELQGLNLADGATFQLTGKLPAAVQVAAVWAGLSRGCTVSISRNRKSRVYCLGF